MKILKYIIFFVAVLFSCTNSKQEARIIELEEENRLALQTIDSLKQLDAFKFNEILLKESGKPDDTLFISDYEAFLVDAKTDFWINLVNNRISIIKTRSARQATEKRLFGTWEWVETDGGWGISETPETENETRKIVINDDYTIQYFKNGKKTKQDTFYITTDKFMSLSYFTVIHLVNQKITTGFYVRGTGHNNELIFYTPWGMDFPSEKFKRVNK